MKNRFRLYRRKKGGTFYSHDSETGKQESLGTKDRAEATTLLNARELAAAQQPDDEAKVAARHSRRAARKKPQGKEPAPPNGVPAPKRKSCAAPEC